MKLAERYLVKEILATTCLVTFVLLCVFSCHQLLRLFGHDSDVQVPLSIALQLVVVQLPSLLCYFLPLFFFLSAVITLLRLRHNNELIVLEASGLSTQNLQAIIMKAALPVVIVVSFFVLFAKPYLGHSYEVLKAKAISQASMDLLTPGKFYAADRGKVIYYATQKPGHDKPSMFIAMKPELPQKPWTILLAQQAKQQQVLDENTVVLEKGAYYQGQPGKKVFSMTSFQSIQKWMMPQVKTITDNPKFMSNRVLWENIRHPFYSAELHWRVAGILSMLVLILQVLPLAKAPPRQTSYASVLIGVLCYVVYINLLLMLRSGIKQGWISYWLGLWPVHAFMILITCALYYFKGLSLSQCLPSMRRKHV